MIGSQLSASEKNRRPVTRCLHVNYGMVDTDVITLAATYRKRGARPGRLLPSMCRQALRDPICRWSRARTGALARARARQSGARSGRTRGANRRAAMPMPVSRR